MRIALTVALIAAAGMSLFLVQAHAHGHDASRYSTVTENARNLEPVRRVEHTASFTIEQSVDDVFPLFSAEQEKYWVPNWDYVNLTGRVEMREDDVFLTLPHDSAHGSNNVVWIVNEYDRDRHLLKLYRLDPVEIVAFYTIDCEWISEASTRVDLTIGFLPLSEKGEAFVSGCTQQVR